MGSSSAQCHENGTCVCRPGFVGYKCDRCQENFFLAADGTRCEECPTCYALVKGEVSAPTPAGPGHLVFPSIPHSALRALCGA